MKFKRYCKTLTLEDDPELIQKYKQVHAMGQAWPEIGEGMKQVGIIDMEIYLHGHTLFMIMDTVPDFDHESAMQKLSTLPRQQEWEAFVSQFQKTSSAASADDKWQLMERIYELDQQAECPAREGQQKSV